MDPVKEAGNSQQADHLVVEIVVGQEVLDAALEVAADGPQGVQDAVQEEVVDGQEAQGEEAQDIVEEAQDTEAEAAVEVEEVRLKFF